ncbi:MAG: hypothetical protein ACSHW1_11705 [Yoonia sp.]|uniref:hypothetical protein n=1 Tax=Yoonia sp. TaxID=2212373 RepID=UPI003EF516C4
MDFLFSLEDSGLGQLVSSSIWGYPIFLSFHALGMGIVVGISVMFALRILGLAYAVPVTAIAPYWRLAIAGFTVNLISGTALLFGSASSLAFNWAFQSKIAMLIVSLFLTHRMVKVCIKQSETVSRNDKILAILALSSWTLTLIFGRLIGYIF